MEAHAFVGWPPSLYFFGISPKNRLDSLHSHSLSAKTQLGIMVAIRRRKAPRDGDSGMWANLKLTPVI